MSPKKNSENLRLKMDSKLYVFLIKPIQNLV